MKTYQEFCDNIASKLFGLIEENGSLLKWKRNWSVNGSQALPFSKSGLYHGGNLLALLLAQVEKGFTKNKWITFNQAQQLGGSVLKGAKSEIVYFWTPIKVAEIVEGKKTEKIVPLFKTYRVFNIEQTSLADSTSTEELQDKSIVDTIAQHKVAISTFGNQPRYQPKEDVIVMPDIKNFHTKTDYDTTLLHELVHWTGHTSRLDRLTNKVSEDKARAEEELVAEIGSVFLATHFGIDGDLLNHASYIAGWKELLEPKDIMRAVTNAVKAFEYLISS